MIDDRPAVEVPEDDAARAGAVAAHEAVTGEPARLGGVPGATDGTVLTAARRASRRSSTARAASGSPTRPTSSWRSTSSSRRRRYAEAARRFLRGTT